MGIDRAARKSGHGGFVMVPHEVQDCHAWRALSTTARALWLDLVRQAGKSNNGTCGTHLLDIPGQKNGLSSRGWKSTHTVFNAAFELEALGFIECEVEGQFARGGKTPKLWSLTHLDVFERRDKGIKAHPATHAYRRWQSTEQAQDALRKAQADLAAMRARKAAEKKSKMQKLHRLDAETASESAPLDAVSAHSGADKMQKLHRRNRTAKPRKASNGAGSKPIQASEGTDFSCMQKLHTYIDMPCAAGNLRGVDSPALTDIGPNLTTGRPE